MLCILNSLNSIWMGVFLNRFVWIFFWLIVNIDLNFRFIVFVPFLSFLILAGLLRNDDIINISNLKSCVLGHVSVFKNQAWFGQIVALMLLWFGKSWSHLLDWYISRWFRHPLIQIGRNLIKTRIRIILNGRTLLQETIKGNNWFS